MKYLEAAKKEGGAVIAFLISQPGESSTYGPTYKLNEVLNGYLDDTWNFDNAEEDYKKQSAEED